MRTFRIKQGYEAIAAVNIEPPLIESEEKLRHAKLGAALLYMDTNKTATVCQIEASRISATLQDIFDPFYDGLIRIERC